MAVPALRIPVTADISQFQREMQRTTDVAGKAALAVTKQVITMNAGWIASQGAAGAATLAFGRVLGVLGPIALGITAVKNAFALMGYATDLAKARIEEFNKVTEEANASGFSTEFFQRISKSGGEARDKVDDLTEALKKFNAESQPKLGGSALQQRLDELTKAGNLKGNSGVAALGSANDSEGRLRAVVSLIDQAIAKGERLAALDIAGKAFGPKVQEALRADSGYLDDMLKRADALKQTQLISDADLGRAQELTRRMDAAQKILAERWKPVQDDLAAAGTNYHENWVGITETLASCVGYATTLYQTLKAVPDWFAKGGNASFWNSLTEATGKLGLNSSPESVGITMVDPNLEQATKRLRAELQNYKNVTREMQAASDVAFAVRGDKSKAPDKGGSTSGGNSFDTAIDTLARHTARTEADTKAVGLGANALAEYRAEAALMVAAEQAGIPVTQALRERIAGLAKDAGHAAETLERAKVANEIDFGKQTAFLSQEDVSIAKQLAGIYGNNVPAALASSEAAALRMNGALSDISRTLQDTNRGLFTDFSQQIRNGATAMDALRTAGVNALGKIADKLMQMAADNLWASAFGGSSGLGGLLGSLFRSGPTAVFGAAGGMGVPTFAASGGYISGPGSSTSDSIPARLSNGEFVVNAKATSKHRGLLEALNSPGFASGGMVGAPRLPNVALPSIPSVASNDNSSVSVSMPISIDARGADSAGLARVENQLAALKNELPSRVVSAVQDAKKRRVLA